MNGCRSWTSCVWPCGTPPCPQTVQLQASIPQTRSTVSSLRPGSVASRTFFVDLLCLALRNAAVPANCSAAGVDTADSLDCVFTSSRVSSFQDVLRGPPVFGLAERRTRNRSAVSVDTADSIDYLRLHSVQHSIIYEEVDDIISIITRALWPVCCGQSDRRVVEAERERETE
ncbi:hypothetical protein J6590_062547 [Homalodisca vitripennis]|nr:hypothetical protein J6590_062547 [Homalodisca vitripennis]